MQVISGTHRPADLIPAFAAALKPRVEYLAVLQEAAIYCADRDRWSYEYCRSAFAPEEGEAELVHDLIDALDSTAPAGHYFGAHPGDGAAFGFWEAEE